MSGAGQAQQRPAVPVVHGDEDEGGEAGVVRGEQCAVEQVQDPLVVLRQGSRACRVLRILPVRTAASRPLPATSPRTTRVSRRVGAGVDVVEVPADPFVVLRGVVAAGVLHPVDVVQRRRQQFAHQRGGDGGLLGVEAGRGQGGPGPRGEQAREDLLVLAEGPFGAGAQQDERPGGHPVAGEGRDDDGTDRRGEALGDHPVGEVGGVDPAGRHGREALEGLGETRYGGDVDLPDGLRDGAPRRAKVSGWRRPWGGATSTAASARCSAAIEAAISMQRPTFSVDRSEPETSARIPDRVRTSTRAVSAKRRSVSSTSHQTTSPSSPAVGCASRRRSRMRPVSGPDPGTDSPSQMRRWASASQDGTRSCSQSPLVASGRRNRAASLIRTRPPCRSTTSTG